MNERRGFDAVVIGAGPAGALAARGLAQRGAAVLLVDKQPLGRPKVCGCCLNASALTTLERVGLGGLAGRLGARPLDTLELSAGGRRARVPLPPGAALSRTALDAALVEAARHAGAQCRDRVSAKVLPPEARVSGTSGGSGGGDSGCLLYTSPSPRDQRGSRMPSSA